MARPNESICKPFSKPFQNSTTSLALCFFISFIPQKKIPDIRISLLWYINEILHCDPDFITIYFVLFTLSYWERDDARRVHLVSEKKEKGHGISKTAEFWKINYILYGSGNAERCSQYRRQSSWSSSALLFYSVFVVISCSFVAAQINALIVRVKYPKPGRVSLSGIGFGYGPPVPGVSGIG